MFRMGFDENGRMRIRIDLITLQFGGYRKQIGLTVGYRSRKPRRGRAGTQHDAVRDGERDREEGGEEQW